MKIEKGSFVAAGMMAVIFVTIKAGSFLRHFFKELSWQMSDVGMSARPPKRQT
jgi:hypothetical protein